MSKIRSLGVAAVFLAGCAVGGASARFAVPKAHAQQAASFPRWEYYCFPAHPSAIGMSANAVGADGWELVATMPGPDSVAPGTWCFRRPKM